MASREAIEAKLNRGRMQPEAAKRLVKFNAKQIDWWGDCKRCGKTLTGTPKELANHTETCDGK